MSNRTVSWGGLLLAVGSIGVVVTSVFYALSPVAAALPAGGDILAALEGSLAGRVTLTLAGSFGIVADVLFAAGSLLLLIYREPAGLAIERVGWVLGALSVVIFVFVDALSAGVLSVVAGLGVAGYLGFKLLYNILFVLGTLVFGLSAPALFAGELMAASSVLPRWVSAAGLAAGAVGFVAAAVWFAGVALPLVIGLSIALGSCVFAAYGFLIARKASASRAS
jgi:hypothetical protein